MRRFVARDEYSVHEGLMVPAVTNILLAGRVLAMQTGVHSLFFVEDGI